MYLATILTEPYPSVFRQAICERSSSISLIMDDKIDENSFRSEAYKNLYDALRSTVATCTFEKEPAFDGYYSKVYELYDKISNIQKNLKAGYENGKTCEQFVAEMRSALFGVG